MARKGGKDRGLYRRLTAAGKTAWYVRISIHGQMQNFGSWPTKTEAQQFRDRMKGAVLDGRYFPDSQSNMDLTVKELVETYLPMAKHRLAYREQHRFGTWWTDRLGTRVIQSLTKHDIETARVALRTGGRLKQRSATTINHHLKFLRHAMREVIRPRSWVLDFWADIKLDQPDEAPTLIVTPEQEGRLYRELGQPDADYARLGVLCGLRRGQLFGLRWEWWRWNEGGAMIPSFKRQKARFVAFPPEGMAIARELHQHQGSPGSGWMFPGPHNPAEPLDPNAWYKYTFKPAAIRAGLYQLGITFHTLRHTWSDRLAQRGASARVIQKAGGWSSLAMVERYTHPYDQELRNAVDRAAQVKPTATKLQRKMTGQKKQR